MSTPFSADVEGSGVVGILTTYKVHVAEVKRSHLHSAKTTIRSPIRLVLDPSRELAVS